MDRFAALAEPNRRRIVEIIAREGAIAATDISDQFSISAPAISQHLKVLREAKLIKMEKKAQHRIYSIHPDGMEDMWEWLSRMRDLWNKRFDAFDALLLEEHNKPNKPKGKKK